MSRVQSYSQRIALIVLVFLLSASTLVLLNTDKSRAAPGVISFPLNGNTITCNVALASGNLSEWTFTNGAGADIVASFHPGYSGAFTRSSTVESQAQDETSPLNRISDAIFDNQNLIWAYMVGVSEVNNYDCMDYGLMVQSPDNPNAFVGTYLNYANSSGPTYLIRTGTYSVATKSIRINNGTKGSLGQSYEIKNSSDAVATHESFTDSSGSSGGGTGSTGGAGGGTVSAGPCAGYPAGPVFDSCYNLQFVDFIHIQFRGELYRLNEWEGDRMSYFLIDSYDPARKSANTFKPDCTPYFQFGSGTGNGELDIDIDGGSGDSDEIDNFVQRMNSLPTSFTGGSYTDYDLKCNDEPPHTYFSSTNGTPRYTNVTNLRRMLSYFPAEGKIAFIEHLDPAGNEKVLGNLIFTQSPDNPNVFTSGKVYDSCGDGEGFATITVDGNIESMSAQAWRAATLKFPSNQCSSFITDFNVFVRGASTGETVSGNSTGGAAIEAQTDAGSTENDPPEKTCSSEGGGLGWIVCPVLYTLDVATVWLEDRLGGFLFIDQSQFDSDGQGEGLYRAWSTLRGIATVIIVIIALIMIFSQAMGDGAFDNYSVKKLLPRLLMAGIAIQLSWFLMIQLINVFNILGDGIAGLMLSPFTIEREGVGTVALTPETKLSEILPTASTGGQGLMAGIVIAGGFALVGAVVPLAIGAAGALLVAFVTLIVRNIIVFLGVVFAPVAIAMSVLPGTQKTSKWWWESFEKALLMYPIVMVLLSAGKIVSYVLMQSGDPNEGLSGISTVAAIAAWYAPFFFLPKALQAGGSALGKVTGLAGDKSKGMFDRARNWDTDRKKKVKEIKNTQALSNGGIRGGLANFKSGNFGGIRRNTRTATRMSRDQQVGDAQQKAAQTSAYQEYAEKRKLEGVKNASLVLDQAEIKVDQVGMNARAFNLDAAKAEMELKEAEIAVNQASAAMSTSGMNIGDKGAVLAHYNAAVAGKEGDAQRTAALKQLTTLGADSEIRGIQQRGTADQQRVVNENASSSWFQSGLKDKAPDLTKGGAANAFGSVPVASKMHDWSDETLKIALEHNGGQNVQEILNLAQSDPDFAASLDSKKRAVLEQAAHTASGGAAGTAPPPGLVNYAKKATS